MTRPSAVWTKSTESSGFTSEHQNYCAVILKNFTLLDILFLNFNKNKSKNDRAVKMYPNIQSKSTRREKDFSFTVTQFVQFWDFHITQMSKGIKK